MIAFLLAAELTLSTPDLTCRVRDKAGHLVRSRARKRLFWRLTGYPEGRPGYVVDHTIPLTCSGCDVPSNMGWLTVEDWKRKSRWERQPCAGWTDGTYVRLIQAGIDARGVERKE